MAGAILAKGRRAAKGQSCSGSTQRVSHDQGLGVVLAPLVVVAGLLPLGDLIPPPSSQGQG